MLFTNKINNLYIINGLARSGNHLFITWLLSSFDMKTTCYLNNVKLNKFNFFSDNIDIKKLIKKCLITSDNNLGEKIDDNIKKNLLSTKKCIKFIKKNQNIENLILSVENQNLETIYDIQNKFFNVNKIYKIIILRDLLNLFASRIESEKKFTNLDNNIYYRTDNITIDYWLNNIKAINDDNFIVYNYNKFLCVPDFKDNLAKQLNINNNNLKITFNKFGLTKGSSFKQDSLNITDYFLRWKKYLDNDLIKLILDNNNLLDIICKNFYLCISDNKITICNNDLII